MSEREIFMSRLIGTGFGIWLILGGTHLLIRAILLLAFTIFTVAATVGHTRRLVGRDSDE